MTYFHKALDKSHAISDGFEQTVLSTMPPAMASKTASLLYGDWLSNLPLFKVWMVAVYSPVAVRLPAPQQ